MVKTEQLLELEFTGKSPKEYFDNDNKQCFFCNKKKHGDEVVIEVNGEAVLGKVKVEVVTFPMNGINYSFPICTQHLDFFYGLLEMVKSSCDGLKIDNQ